MPQVIVAVSSPGQGTLLNCKRDPVKRGSNYALWECIKSGFGHIAGSAVDGVFISYFFSPICDFTAICGLVHPSARWCWRPNLHKLDRIGTGIRSISCLPGNRDTSFGTSIEIVCTQIKPVIGSTRICLIYTYGIGIDSMVDGVWGILGTQ